MAGVSHGEPRAGTEHAPEPRVLNASARRIVAALAEAMLCDYDEEHRLCPPRPELVERVVLGIDHSIGAASAQARRSWLLGLFLLEWLSLVYLCTLRRMSRLRIGRRLLYLERLETTRFGLLAAVLAGFKVQICIVAFEEGPELASTGFDRPSLTSRRQLRTLAPEARSTPSTAPARDATA